MLGLLGQVVMKVKVLLIGRRISEQHIQRKPDGRRSIVLLTPSNTRRSEYMQFSTELAHEYVNLGKTAKAANLYTVSWNMMNNLNVSEETRAMFLLRYSESLVATGNILKRCIFSRYHSNTT
jgi:separase